MGMHSTCGQPAAVTTCQPAHLPVGTRLGMERGMSAGATAADTLPGGGAAITRRAADRAASSRWEATSNACTCRRHVLARRLGRGTPAGFGRKPGWAAGHSRDHSGLGNAGIVRQLHVPQPTALAVPEGRLARLLLQRTLTLERPAGSASGRATPPPAAALTPPLSEAGADHSCQPPGGGVSSQPSWLGGMTVVASK